MNGADLYLELLGLLTLPGAKASTTALSIVNILRHALLDAAEVQTDSDERVRLRNLAALLPQWGA
jgi:hypothetical protein